MKIGGENLSNKWVTYFLAFFLVTVVAGGYLGYKQYEAKEQYRLDLENQYQLSFRELLDDLENLEVQSGKTLVSNSPRQVMLNLSDIWRNAYAAQNNLARLPLSHLALSRTQKFLTQIADFSYSIAKTTGPDITLQPHQWSMLNDLYTQARYLSAQLHQLEMDIEKGQISWAEIDNKASNKLSKVSSNLIHTNFRMVEKQMLNYPNLAYDGPFSDQLSYMYPGVSGKKITEQQAVEIGKKYVDPAGKLNYSIKKIGEAKGDLATYSLEVQPNKQAAYVLGSKAQENIYLDISKKGGNVVWLVNSRNIDSKKLTFNQALLKAKEFLISRGYEQMVLTSYVEYQKSITFSFAYKQGNVMVYPDLIKVKVALDDGQIIGVEAMRYLLSHRERKIPSKFISQAEAREKLNPHLEVEKSSLAIIPSYTKEEILCYEFKVKMKKNRFLIYVNALNGEEQNILRVVEGKNLYLTM